MNVNECIRSRRSIRKYQSRLVDHSIIDSIVSDASYSPSWKNTQITRYIAIEDLSILETIAEQFTPDYNSNIIKQIPVLIADRQKVSQRLGRMLVSAVSGIDHRDRRMLAGYHRRALFRVSHGADIRIAGNGADRIGNAFSLCGRAGVCGRESHNTSAEIQHRGFVA